MVDIKDKKIKSIKRGRIGSALAGRSGAIVRKRPEVKVITKGGETC